MFMCRRWGTPDSLALYWLEDHCWAGWDSLCRGSGARGSGRVYRWNSGAGRCEQVQKNHRATGKLFVGAVVEREIPVTFVKEKKLS